MIGAGFLISISNFIFGLIQVLLGLRIILKLFGANPNADFVDWIYENTDPLLEPFVNMFPSPEFAGQFELEISSLFAILVYSLAAYLIASVVKTLEKGTKK